MFWRGPGLVFALCASSVAFANAGKPLPVDPCGLVTAGMAHTPDFSGISFLAARDRFRADVKVAEGDGFVVEYYPRTDEYSVFIPAGQDGKPALVGEFDARSGYYGLRGSYGGSTGIADPAITRHARPENLARMLAAMKLIETRFGVPVPQQRRGYPGLRDTVGAITAGTPVQPETVAPGTIVLYEDRDGDFIATRWEKYVVDAEGRQARVYAAQDPRFGAFGFEIKPDFSGVRPAHTVGEDPTRVVDLFMNNLVVKEHSEWATGKPLKPGRVWVVPPEHVDALARLAPKYDDKFRDRTEDLPKYLTLNALLGMQYEKWGHREREVENRRGLKNEPRYSDPRFTAANYGAGIDALIERFGEENFVEMATMMMDMNLQNMHSAQHEKGSPYKPHSDIRSGWGYDVKTVRETLRDTYPVPENPNEWLAGGMANVVSLHGDAEFWTHLQKKHPTIFKRLADWYRALEEPTRTRHVFYGEFDVHPRGVLKHYYPEAYAVLLAARPDFATDVTAEQSLIRRSSSNH